MGRWRVVAAVLLMVVAVAGQGIASAAPGGSFADRSVTRTTADGWRVTLVKADERVRSVPPLNQSPWSREGFLSLRGEARIEGSGSSAVDAGAVTTGFSITCNTDVTSGITLGVSGGPSAQMSISYPPAVVLGVQVMPNISTTLRPGTITDVPFGTKRLQGPAAGVSLEGVSVKVDGCLGPVAVRAYVRVALSTKANDTTFHVYGKPHIL